MSSCAPRIMCHTESIIIYDKIMPTFVEYELFYNMNEFLSEKTSGWSCGARTSFSLWCGFMADSSSWYSQWSKVIAHKILGKIKEILLLPWSNPNTFQSIFRYIVPVVYNRSTHSNIYVQSEAANMKVNFHCTWLHQ